MILQSEHHFVAFNQQEYTWQLRIAFAGHLPCIEEDDENTSCSHDEKHIAVVNNHEEVIDNNSSEQETKDSEVKESEQRKPSQKWFYQEIPCQRKRRRIQPEPLSANKKPVKNVKLVKSVKTATKSVQTKLKEKDSEVSKRLLQVEKISNLILSEVRNCLQLTQSLIIHTTLYSIQGPKNKTKGESQ